MSKQKSYRLANDKSGESFTLKAGHKGQLTVLSEIEEGTGKAKVTRKVRRAIRHCPNQRSIFLDEQDDHALVAPIIFINGYLHVPETQPLTVEFLDNHPSNVLNGGIWFEPVNEEQEAAESLEREDLELELRMAVKNMSKTDDGLHELSAVVAVLEDDIKAATTYGMQQLRRVINNKIMEDPYYFTDGAGKITIFEDDDVKRQYITLRALNEGILQKSVDGRTMMWSKGKKAIVSCPMGSNLTEFFADFLASDEGMLVAAEIVKQS